MTAAEMEAFLFARARGGMKLGLERMQRAMRDAAPGAHVPVFHVAGTNGKGSVCAFLERALRASGRRTGLYTSPHLEQFGERIRVDGVPASDGELVRVFEELQHRMPWAFESGPEGLTFFELVTLLGFAFFARADIEVAVIEVGLGGRFDATNVVRPTVSCITPIGFDHQEFLGHTLREIASEKGGIVKPGVPVVVARQEAEALGTIASIAHELGAPMSLEGRDFALEERGGSLAYVSERGEIAGLSLSLRGVHQRSNAAVALRALEVSGLGVSEQALREGMSQATWPGRLEVMRTSPEVVLDGAHNPHAAAALAESIRTLFAGRRVHLVLGVLADKDSGPMLELLLPLVADVVATQPHSPRALEAEKLGNAARRHHPAVVVEADPGRAIERAIASSGPDDVVLACGSLYLVGEIRAHLRGTTAGGPRELLK